MIQHQNSLLHLLTEIQFSDYFGISRYFVIVHETVGCLDTFSYFYFIFIPSGYDMKIVQGGYSFLWYFDLQIWIHFFFHENEIQNTIPTFDIYKFFPTLPFPSMFLFHTLKIKSDLNFIKLLKINVYMIQTKLCNQLTTWLSIK